MNLRMTNHAEVRCQQRGIRKNDLELAVGLGADTEIGIFFGRREANELICRLKRLIRTLERVKHTCIVTDGSTAITAYKARGRRGHGRRLGER